MKQVLIVDADADLRSAIKEALEGQGFDVHEANHGKLALELLLAAKEPSLVVLDLEMPIMSGGDLVDVMKRYHRLSRVPVLIVSGSKRERVPHHDRIVGVIRKPLDLQVLVDTVRSSVGGLAEGS